MTVVEASGGFFYLNGTWMLVWKTGFIVLFKIFLFKAGFILNECFRDAHFFIEHEPKF